MDSPERNNPQSHLQPLLHPSPSSTPPPSLGSLPSIRLQYCTSLLALLSVGTAYSFSSWAPDLKERLSYTQSDVEMIGYMGNLGLLLPFAAILVNRYPPPTALVLGGGLVLGGNALLALGVSGWEGVPSWMSAPSMMAFANAAVIVGVTCVYILVISINQWNLPRERLGAGLSVLVMCYGLSASLFSLLYVYVVQRNLTAYFITAGLLASSICALNAFTLKRLPRVDQSSTTASASTSNVTPSEEAAAVKLADGSFMSAFRVLGYAGRTSEFWLIVLFMMTTSGTGYAVFNNTGNIVQSFNGGVVDSSFTFLCILTLSAGNALGRLAVGLSDLASFRRGWFGVCSAALMFCVWTYSSFLVSTKQRLSFGSVWAIAPVLTSETWPAELFPIVWAWIASTPPISSFLFNRYIGHQYDLQADAAHNCVGRKCWVDGFGMGMAVTAVGIGLSLVLVKYTRVGKRGPESRQLSKGAMEDKVNVAVELT